MAYHPVLQSRNDGQGLQGQQGSCRQETRVYPEHEKVKEAAIKRTRPRVFSDPSSSTRIAEMKWPRRGPRRRNTIIQIQPESYEMSSLSLSKELEEDSTMRAYTTRPELSFGHENLPRILSPLESTNSKSLHSIPSRPESANSESKPCSADIISELSSVIMNEPIFDEIDAPRNHALKTYDNTSRSEHHVVKDPIFMTEWSNINQRRNEVFILRSKIHEMRRILRTKQNLKATTEDRLIQRVRLRELGVEPFRNTPDSQKSILALIEDCQNARDDYGPFEDDCNMLEDQLYRDEFALDRLETQFFSHWSVALNMQGAESNSPQMRQEASPGPPVHYQEHDDDDVEFSYHPLVETYLSKKGDLDILREQLVDFEERLDSLKEEQKSRSHYGMSMASGDRFFLENSQTARYKLLGEIQKAEVDVEELQRECFTMKLVDAYGEPTTLNGDLWQESNQWKKLEPDEDIDSRSEASEYSKYSILLPQAKIEPTSSTEKEIALELNSKTEEQQLAFSPVERVNSWMLDTLRCSAIDVNHLARESKWMSIKIGDPWQHAVLTIWFKDKFSIPIPTLVSYTSSMTTQVPFQSKKLGLTLTPNPKQPHKRKDNSPRRSRNFTSDRSDTTDVEDNVVGIVSQQS